MKMTSINARQKLKGRFCKAMSRNTNSIKFTYTKSWNLELQKEGLRKKSGEKCPRLPPPKSGTLGIHCRVFIASLHWQGGS